MTLLELQEVLGDRIAIAIDKDIPEDERRRETELSQTIASLAKQMINNADIVLRADRMAAEGKLVDGKITRMIG